MGQESNNALMQQLKNHYGLNVDLFTLESAFFFEGAQRQHNLETLRHLSSFGDMVLFLTGAKGAGKTTLLKRLQYSEFEALNVVYLDAEQFINKAKGHTNIFSECARLLELTLTNATSPEVVLKSLLKECHRIVASNGKRTLFAFDNADRISKKDMQTLLDFCRGIPPESALVMLFAGSSSLLQWSKIGSNIEQAAWCHQIQLKPLSQMDVSSYLEQALEAAGSLEGLDLSEPQLQQLADLGKGLPGRINKLFPSVVLEPGLLKIQTRHKKPAFPGVVLFGLAGLLIASFIFVSYQHGMFDRILPVFSLDKTEDNTPSIVVAQNDDMADALEKERQQASRLIMLDNVLKEKGLSLSGVNEKQTEIPTEKEAVDGAALVSKLALGSNDGVNVAPKDTQIETASSDNKGQVVEVVNKEGEGQQKPAKADLVIDAKENGKTDTLNSSIVHDKFKSKTWLSKQPSTSYMAQILGSYQEQTAQKFIEKIGKQKFEVYYLKTEHKGKSWYVVFYGIFPAKTHAQDAVKNAPKVVKNQNPWIRKASDVFASYPTVN